MKDVSLVLLWQVTLIGLLHEQTLTMTQRKFTNHEVLTVKRSTERDAAARVT